MSDLLELLVLAQGEDREYLGVLYREAGRWPRAVLRVTSPDGRRWWQFLGRDMAELREDFLQRCWRLAEQGGLAVLVLPLDGLPSDRLPALLRRLKAQPWPS